MTRRDRAELAALREWVGEVNHIARHTLERQHDLEARLEQLTDQLDEVLNVSRSSSALARRLTRGTNELRTELDQLLEQLRASTDDGSGATTTLPAAAPATSSLVTGHVQLGAGSPIEGDPTQIDTLDLPGTDLVARAHRLPIAAGSLTRLTLHRFIERHSETRLREELVPYWTGLLAPGAHVDVISIDLERMLDDWREGRATYDAIRRAVVERADGTDMRSAFTSDALIELFAASGVTLAPAGQRVGADGSAELVLRGTTPGGT